MSRNITGLMVFLGAFLAFGMEPIIGRLVTPFFGGAVHVWIVSLMIFQGLLLTGYLYAHLVAPRIGAWHLLFLLLPLLQWPLNFVSEVAPKAPLTTLIIELLAQISLPFAVLSTTAVVAQSWWFRSSINPRLPAPFFLYGISNLGAMVALFAYPFLAEPFLRVTLQRGIWSIGYLFYIGVTVWAWHLLKPQRDTLVLNVNGEYHPSWTTLIHWLALGAGPSALLLAVTNVIAMEVGSFPMVWVLPLALYLTSFIVTFREHKGFIISHINFCLIDFALLALIAVIFLSSGYWALFLILLFFFVLCVAANERLYCLRPHPSQLTIYYLMISVGGWIGGLLVSLAAPLIFSSVAEYPLAVVAIVIACWQPEKLAWWQSTTLIKGGFRLACLMVGCTVLGLSFWYDPNVVYSIRNFYGISRIIDTPKSGDLNPHRKLVHGNTLHGLQYLNHNHLEEPLGYYYEGGALERAASLRKIPARVAMVGMGAGDAMAWFKKDEDITIFEIDKDMVMVAQNWFSFLKNTLAKTKIVIGDARLNLELETKKNIESYDVIFIDAFSGDGIPTHLLTLEAINIYLSRLKENGFLIIHVSNRYYDLRPILKAAAQTCKLSAVVTQRTGRISSRPLCIDPDVVVLARRPEIVAPLLVDRNWSLLETTNWIPDVGVWSDDYVNTLPSLLSNWF